MGKHQAAIRELLRVKLCRAVQIAIFGMGAWLVVWWYLGRFDWP